jgi:hypothetical protein
MNFWVIYLVGCLTAFIMHAEAQYYTKLRRNIKAKYPFDNFDEVCDALMVAVGSWVAVMILFFNNNDD